MGTRPFKDLESEKNSNSQHIPRPQTPQPSTMPQGKGQQDQDLTRPQALPPQQSAQDIACSKYQEIMHAAHAEFEKTTGKKMPTQLLLDTPSSIQVK